MDASLANGEDEYDAAYRIWSMFPTDRSGLEPYADADEADGEEEGTNVSRASADRNLRDLGPVTATRSVSPKPNLLLNLTESPLMQLSLMPNQIRYGRL